MDEKKIIAQFKAGDLKADKILYDEFYQGLCYFTERIINSREDGQEIAIDAFEKLFQRRQNFESINDIKAFLYVCSRNSCFNYLRSRKRLQKREKEFFAMQDEQFVQLELVEATVIRQIHEAVNSLPDQCRLIFQLFYYEERNYEEIAAALGIAKSTVSTQRRRAIRLLREKLGPAQYLFLAILLYDSLLLYVLSQPVPGK